MGGSERRVSVVVMADDDEDDCLLVRDALNGHPMLEKFLCLEDGAALLDYLYRRTDQFVDCDAAPRPDLILLDLNMPVKDGREVLREIKSDPDLRSIPVVILTTSEEEEDVQNCYKAGANSFFVKPRSFADLSKLMKSIMDYWFDKARLPEKEQCH